MTSSAAGATRIALKFDTDRIAVIGLALTVVVPLLVFVVLPLAGIFKTSFVTADGIGFGNYIRYISSPKFSKVVGNSLAVAATTTARRPTRRRTRRPD